MFHTVLLNQKDLNKMYLKEPKEKAVGRKKKPTILLAQFLYVYHTAFEQIISSFFPKFIPKIVH